MNAYMKQMHEARKKGASSFTYKGSRYVRTKTKTGLVTYKKAGTGGSTRSGGAVRTAGKVKKGGAAHWEGKAV